MATTTSNQTTKDMQALKGAKEVSEMAGKIINRFGKAVQGILASAVLAGGLLLATPAVGSADESGPCPFDWDGDGMVASEDFLFVLVHYRQSEPAGKGNGDGTIMSADMGGTLDHYRHTDK